ncbi:hypothetical protein GDO86_015621 [Hymenochirus boettgeri]|uniref:Short myomegalin-like EB1 binding protein N-terminal domain-containing protein n=1 Tax=Hymenochirus boettgeri TaxID=247094 RepID=A0A8T2JYK9_9PIPI|nr:hypothetical protein GDO86_015621 [Hymenochirus boettgeri]
MSDHCRLCASPLRGSLRKWLFGGSGSLSVLYSQIMGSHVSRSPPGRSPRSNGNKGTPEDSEFLCGKCCHSLNVYHRYDLVLSRMRQLYEHRSNRLFAEKKKLSFTLRTIHAKAWGLPFPEYLASSHNRNPSGYRGSCSDLSSSSIQKSKLASHLPGHRLSCPDSTFLGHQNSYHGSLGSLTPQTPTKPYQQLLEHDRSKWEHESWWKDRSESCSHCAKGERCQSCSSWRVSDDNYEIVCSVPRRKNLSGAEELDDYPGLHRSKSLGSFGGGSSKGSLLSFSTSSLETLSFTGDDEIGVFWEPPSPLASSPSAFHCPKPFLQEALMSLKGIQYNPLNIPTHSKIPVKEKRHKKGEPQTKIIINEKVSPREEPLGEEAEEDCDEYLGIGPEVCRTHDSHTLRIQDTINWLQAQVQKKDGCAHHNQKESSKKERQLIQELLRSLDLKEEVLEGCLAFLLSLPDISDSSCGNVVTLIEKLKSQEYKLKNAEDELAENFHQCKAETKRLQLVLNEKEEDLGQLSRVVRENQDTITALRDILGEKEFMIQQLEISLDSAIRSAAAQDTLRLAALLEKDALITAVQGALSSSNQDVEALADSLLSQGLDDLGGALPVVSQPETLVAQLNEKSCLLSQALTDRQKQSIKHQTDVQDLLNALNESRTLLQNQLQHCKQRLQTGAEEQTLLRDTLRMREAELRAKKQSYTYDIQQAQVEIAQLQSSLKERDMTIQKLLQDAQSRDHTIKRLQDSLSRGGVIKEML